MGIADSAAIIKHSALRGWRTQGYFSFGNPENLISLGIFNAILHRI
jgi:hypothetical protein